MKKITLLILSILIYGSSFATGLTAYAAGSNVTCNGLCDGMAGGWVTGGSGPYRFEWTGPVTIVADTINSLCAGTYTLTVTDSSNMSTATATLVIYEPSPLTIGATGGSSICSGSCVTVGSTVTGGTPPYVYMWAPGMITSPSPMLCPNTSTTYTLNVTDANGCSTMASTTISVDPLPDASFSYSGSVFCQSAANPAPTITGDPGGAFTASPLGMAINPTTGVFDLAASASGAYTITYTVVSIGGCSNSQTANITITAAPVANFSYTPSLYCQASALNAIPTFTAGGQAGAFTSMAGLVIDPNTGDVYPNSSALGTYTVMNVVSGFGVCPNDTVVATISVLSSVTASFSMVPDSTAAMAYWAYNSSSSSLSYSWDFGDGNTSSLQSPSHQYTSPSVYNVCLITSAGCADTVCHSLNVTGAIPNTCMALFDAARSAYNSNDFTITDLSYGSNLTYLWDFGDGNTSTQQLPSHNYASVGPYQLCLTIDNGAGCNQTYCDSLFAVDSLGHTAMLPISFTVIDGPSSGTTVGITETVASSTVEVAPNPFNNYTIFTILSSNTNQVYSFEMTDILGKQVKSIKEITDKQFSVSRNGLQDGIYFYKITSNGNTIGKGKVIIK